MKNYWEIKGFIYWEHELSVNNEIDEIWINVGYHLPLITNKNNFSKTLAVSGMMYARKFN